MSDAQVHSRPRDWPPDDGGSRPTDRRDPAPESHHRREREREDRHHPRHESSHRRDRDRDRDRDRARDRSRDRPRSHSRSRRGKDFDDLIPRYRETRDKDRHREVYDDDRHDRRSSRASGRDRERERERERDRDRDRRHSPSGSASKRTRSRSRSPERHHRKKSRRDRSASRRPHDADDREARKRRRHSPPDDRRSSPRPSTRRHRSTDRSSRRDRSVTPRDAHRGHGEARRTSSTRSPRPYRSDEPSRSSTRHPSPSSRSANARRNAGPDPREARDDPYRGSRSGTPRREGRPREASIDRYMPSRPELKDVRDAHPDDSSIDRYVPGRRPEHDGDRYREAGSHPYPPTSQYHDDRPYGRSPAHTKSYRDSPSHSPFPGALRSSRPGSQYPESHYDRGYAPSTGPAHHTWRADGAPSGLRDAGGFRGSRSNGARGSFVGAQGDGGHAGSTDRDHGAAQRPLREEPPKDPDSQESRGPPTGPAADSASSSSSKFSFAFKASSKPPPTAAPKPEISQKFNAPMAPSEAAKPDADTEPPRSAPTGPASGRDGRIPEGPRIAPRMRKVKRVMKRPKPRPTLPEDLAASESVFHRKPGNESVVGSGTYGKVFKGLNVYTKGQVALKRIRMEGERDGFPVTAVREIKLLQSLRHTNIVNLQEVMVERNDCFMVFEYLSHDLTGLLNHPTFTLRDDQRKHLSKQMFEGLDYLHTRGVLHRDIKAANILVSKEGVLKLADFGLARFYAKRHQLDYTNRVITIWYRSPELLLGETKYTAAVDIWSAACVMIEIFDRTAIFPGDGTELHQLTKIYEVLGTPNRQEWPGLVDMAWFELLRPTAKRRNVFAERYRGKLTPAAFDLLEAMFLYDPARRPTAGQVLRHAYFTVEEPLPKQAIELAGIDGEWHEFESKAHRKENERRAREVRKMNEAAAREKKRGREATTETPDAKRVQVDEAMESAVL